MQDIFNEINSLFNNLISDYDKIIAKYNRTDLQKFIDNIKYCDIPITTSQVKECIISSEFDDLAFDFTDYDCHIDYYNVTIRDKNGENEIVLILEDTAFDTAFGEYILNNK